MLDTVIFLSLIAKFAVYVFNAYVYLFHGQVGRSGRFGHLGLAVNLITYEDRFNLYTPLLFLIVFICHMLCACAILSFLFICEVKQACTCTLTDSIASLPKQV